MTGIRKAYIDEKTFCHYIKEGDLFVKNGTSFAMTEIVEYSVLKEAIEIIKDAIGGLGHTPTNYAEFLKKVGEK